MMQSERRRWCCPLCGHEYRIPVAIDDPMACPRCSGNNPSPAIWGTAPETASDPAPQFAAQQSTAASDPELWTTALHDEPLAARPGGALDSAAVERIVAESNARRRKRRMVLMAISAALGMAAVVSVAAFRPFELREIFVRAPRVQANPNEAAPLVAIVDFSTDGPALASVEISDGERRWTYRPGSAPATEHRLALVGLRPGRSHRIRVRVESSGGWFEDESEPLTFATPPLPDDFPPLETTVSQPGKMEPGVTLFGVNRWVEDQRDSRYGYIMMLDSQGEVVWYFRAERGTADMRVLRNGNLLCNNTSYRQVYELDLLGNILRSWETTGAPEPPEPGAIPVEADTLHHEVLELPSGNLLALSTELVERDQFPTSELDPDSPPAPATIVADVILEFDREGKVLRRWRLLDLLDPQRISYGSLTDFWNKTYAHVLLGEECEDWSHANALWYNADDDSLLVSVRHQDCIFKLNLETGKIEWILGDPTGWREPWSDLLLKPKGDLEWPYHLHGPQMTALGTLLMYDNGNYRAIPFTPPTPAPENYSRVVEFRIDEDARTVEQVWEYRGDETFYCPFYGEADRLPKTGNLLVTDGGHIEHDDGTPSDLIPSDHQWARILEITRAEPAETLFEVVLDSGLGSPFGWSVYRSERLPDVATLSDRATAGIKHLGERPSNQDAPTE